MICRQCNNYNDDYSTTCIYCGASLIDYPVKKKRYGLIIAVVVGIIIAVSCLTAGIILYNNKKTTEKYTERLTSAEKYLADADYESAINAYNEAIELDENGEEAYIELSYIYEEMEDDENLDRILTLGYQRTQSAEIKALMDNYLMYGSVYGERTDTVAIADISEKTEVVINTDFLETILNMGYEDYVEMFGSVGITKENGGNTISMTFSGFEGTLYYVNGTEEIVDKSNGIPKGNVRPSYIMADNTGCIIEGDFETLSYDEICSLFNENAEIKQDSSRYYLVLNYLGCEINLECNSLGNVSSGEVWNKIIVPGAGEAIGDSEVTNGGYASGKIIDASSGKGISDVKLTFREGHDNHSGEAVETVSSDSQGNYMVELTEGSYTVCAEADGYNSEYFEISIVKGITMAGQNLTMSSSLNSGEVRIVLEWGSSPHDLDSHLWGSVGGASFHVYYGNRSYGDLAMLDVDDTDAYGPETITIYDISTGTFTYGVEDFSNNNLGSSDTALATSGATVKVYMPGESQPRVFNVPSGNGAYWEVFKIENGSLVEINQLKASY